MSQNWITNVESSDGDESDEDHSESQEDSEPAMESNPEPEPELESESESESSDDDELDLSQETPFESETDEPEFEDKSPDRSGGSETRSEQSEETPEVSSMSVAEMADEQTSDETEDMSMNSHSEESMEVTPEGGISIEDMAQRERKWKILVWGQPGLFKSHFCYTMPEPIAYLDLENKAHDIVHKFIEKEIHFWQPTDFRECQEALSQALNWLESCREENGEIGTIVVDSMALAWDWAKTDYIREAYPMKDEEDVVLSSNMGSSQDSDWQHIKGMHNGEFRDWMTNSPFHFCWTAGETEDYAKVMSGDSDDAKPMKPEGEKNNSHKADTIIRGWEDEDVKRKYGDLTKSNFTATKFENLYRPTFPKVRDVIEGIEDAESDDKAVKISELEKKFEIEVVREQTE